MDGALGTHEGQSFEAEILPHLDAAYNLARWLTRNEQDAEDVTQEAMLRAFRFYGGFRGGNARSWLLRIVRNTTYTWRQANRVPERMTEFDEELQTLPLARAVDAEEALLRVESAKPLRKAMEQLTAEHREILILREMEEMSYKEIAEVTGAPIGTVMSRLARARNGLRALLLGDALVARTEDGIRAEDAEAVEH
jgi:RNA polymerase sigma-70 factor, ECF subfamily